MDFKRIFVIKLVSSKQLNSYNFNQFDSENNENFFKDAGCILSRNKTITFFIYSHKKCFKTSPYGNLETGLN